MADYLHSLEKYVKMVLASVIRTFGTLSLTISSRLGNKSLANICGFNASSLTIARHNWANLKKEQSIKNTSVDFLY